MELLIQILLLMLGFLMLVKGSDWFVEGVAKIADYFHIPQLVIGLTIIAMGTSAPEAAVSIAAACKGNAEITIGNIVGSNILNILIILGITSTLATIAVAKSTIQYEIPYMIGTTLLLMFFGYTDSVISFDEGILLWAAFLIYLTYLFFMAKKKNEKAQPHTEKPMLKLILTALLGLILTVCGSDVTVDAATAIAAYLGMSERLIGLTIVALGTSLPELFTSVSAAQKGKADIAIGNIVGSNIFNILFVVGTTALITPVIFTPNFLTDSIIAVTAGILLLICVWKKKKLTHTFGIFFLICYIGYFISLIY